MAFTGYTTGVLYSATQGETHTGPLIIDNIRYVSSTGGAGQTCRVATDQSTSWLARLTVSASYGLDVNKWDKGVHVDGLQVLSLPEGYVEITLR